MQHTVIAISGPSGSGKSALVHTLVQLLPNARAIHLDDYQATTTFPPDWKQWIQDGCPPDGFVTPQMAADLAAMREEQQASGGWVIVEEPFGRGRVQLSGLIDYVVCIDIPLEIALARAIKRGLLEVPDTMSASEIGSKMVDYIDQYIAVSRDSYAIVNANVKKDCNLIVDGMRGTDALAQEIAAAVQLERQLQG
jgi:uridine kinase